MVALNCAKHAPSLEEKLKESFGKTARRRYYKRIGRCLCRFTNQIAAQDALFPAETPCDKQIM